MPCAKPSKARRPAMDAERTNPSCVEAAAQWFGRLTLDDVPDDVVASAKLRLLDLLGVTLAASALKYGPVIRATVLELGSSGASPLIGFSDRVAPVWAAFGNGALAHALIFDDTHNETIVHTSGPVVGAALAVAAATGTHGKELLTAIVGATELTCRLGLPAVGQFHKSGFQPTAIIGPLGAAFVASRLYGLDVVRMAHAVGNSGSFASGINESWSDGTWTQLLHPGWAAHSGVAAAVLAKSGWSGPSTVLEGRFGLFRSHVQQPGYAFAFERVTEGLGDVWESRCISFKPYPCAHVLHPFLDAILALHREGLRAEAVERIECPIARYMVPVVCEPAAGKKQPASDAQARTSLQFSLAEALVTGRLDALSYSDTALRDPRILALAQRVEYSIDDAAPDSRHFKGWVVAMTRDGRRCEKIEPFNRGSPDHPLRPDEVREKFQRNAATRIRSDAAAALEEFVMGFESNHGLARLFELCSPLGPSS
jgi:2-methylcitrate dehydratase PrpD